MSQSVQARFWAKVAKTDSCWLWAGAKSDGGYGKVRIGGVLYPSHRMAYQWLVGPIPDGLQLDHLCRVRQCVRPSHLEPVTRRENLLRGVSPTAVNARKAECKRGHLLSGDNVRLWRGQRHCRICRRQSSRAYYAQQRVGLLAVR